MLKLENVTITAEEKELIKNVNLTIQDGEIHTLLGRNGIGKSTICRALLKSPGYTVTSGTITFDGISITELSTTDISRLGIYMIAQNPIAIEGVTNAEMLRMAISEKENARVDIFAFNKKLQTICEKLDLPKTFIHRNINDGMSGGERKKNELLHLWMLEPKFVILDEIDSGLDVDALKIVANSLKEYHEKTNCSILLITHNSQILEIVEPDFVHIINEDTIQTGDKSLATKIFKEGFLTSSKTDEVGESDDCE